MDTVGPTPEEPVPSTPYPDAQNNDERHREPEDQTGEHAAFNVLATPLALAIPQTAHAISRKEYPETEAAQYHPQERPLLQSAQQRTPGKVSAASQP